ncbi:MAG TPA: hypothetical protein VNZ26_23310 [Vicinamibacterales bacterium]|nr:hypothetical protein [Vicinamibacterales bacterium]
MASSSADFATMAAWDAVETSDRIRKKEVSLQDVLEAAVGRAEEAQHLGAVFEPAYARARTSVGSSIGRRGRGRGCAMRVNCPWRRSWEGSLISSGSRLCCPRRPDRAPSSQPSSASRASARRV